MGRHSVERTKHDPAGPPVEREQSIVDADATIGTGTPDRELFGDPTVSLYGGADDSH